MARWLRRMALALDPPKAEYWSAWQAAHGSTMTSTAGTSKITFTGGQDG